MRRTSAKRPSPTRGRLVAATARLLQDRGYAATGITEILAGARAPKGSMYHHFPGGKEELAVAAVAAASAGMEASIRAAFARAGSPTDALRQLCSRLAEGLRATEFRSGCPVATTALEVAPTSEPLREACEDAFAAWLAAIARGLEAAGQSPAEAGRNATLVLAAVEGALLLARTFRETTPLDAIADHLAPLLAAPGHPA